MSFTEVPTVTWRWTRIHSTYVFCEPHNKNWAVWFRLGQENISLNGGRWLARITPLKAKNQEAPQDLPIMSGKANSSRKKETIRLVWRCRTTLQHLIADAQYFQQIVNKAFSNPCAQLCSWCEPKVTRVHCAAWRHHGRLSVSLILTALSSFFSFSFSLSHVRVPPILIFLDSIKKKQPFKTTTVFLYFFAHEQIKLQEKRISRLLSTKA